ncbi:MAG TPA: GNAT family N-acetyltransferase [Candidatus Hydrogenedentes bacterium]|nr:GNAT family N-acetyltransferase [Candidatus Hydrogenedentota bacterium]
MVSIKLCDSDTSILGCVPVLSELRPNIPVSDLLPRIKRQMDSGYHLASLEDHSEVKAVAGFRFGDFLAWGRIMYVDDLVVKESERGRGYGGQLLEWLKNHARENGCDQFHLDSGTHRVDAHRFYIEHGMEITSYHFGMKLK